MKYVKLRDGRVMLDTEWKELCDSTHGYRSGLVVKRSSRLQPLFDYVFYKVKEGDLAVTKIQKGFPWKALKQAVIKGDIEYAKFANLTIIGLIFKAKMNKKGEIQLL